MHKRDITIGYACIECRKAFKKYKYIQNKKGSWTEVEYTVVCPQCSAIMFETGSAFKAPRSMDIKAWSRLRLLFESGYTFNPNFPNPYQKSL